MLKIEVAVVAAMLILALVMSYSAVDTRKQAAQCEKTGGILVKQYGHDWQCMELIAD